MNEEIQSFDQFIANVRDLCTSAEQLRDLDPELFDSSPEAELLRGIQAALETYEAHKD